MTTFLQDLRFSLRLLGKDRSFTITALLTLAVCIAANTAMFGIVRSVLLKPLPFPDSDRIVLLYNAYPAAGAPRVGASVPNLYDRLEAVPGLELQTLFRTEGTTFGDADGAERLSSIRATPPFYALTHAQARYGRVFTAADGETGQDRKAMLSYAFWQRKFGGDPSAVGKSLRLNGNPYEIIGVLPASYVFLQNDIDVYLPAAFPPAARADGQRHSNNWQMLGRLAPGATVGVVQQQIDTLNRNLDEKFPEFRQLLKDAQFHTVVVPLQDDVVRDIKAVLYLLWGGVFFVLVIGCVNIANLVIVRASARSREMATRHAIGAELSRLARQIVTETVTLAVVGGGVGVMLGWWMLRSIAAANLDNLPRGYAIGLDPVTVAVVTGLTLVVGLALGIVPAMRLWRMNINLELREEGRGGTAGRRANLVRQALAMVQVAIALLLLIGAGLLLASFQAVMHLDLGFQPANVATASVNLPGVSYPDAPARVSFVDRTLEALRALPGVEAAGGTTAIPFGGNNNSNVILAEGHVMQPGESLLAPMQVIATAGYFETMQIGLARGRLFDARDTADATKTAIIDERLAEKFWPGEDAVGRRLYSPSGGKNMTAITPDTQFYLIVGVVKNVQMLDPRPDVKPVGTFYFPYDQSPSGGLAFAVRTRTPTASIQADISRAVKAIDPQLPLSNSQPMQTWIDDALVGRRMPMLIAIGFGVVALFLASVGIYGVLAYGVSQRRREMGVRMALGGTASDIFQLVAVDGVKIIVIGLILGLAGAFVVGRLMTNLLFGVTPLDPLVIAGMTLTLVVVALVASVIPAWRATTINPIVVLGK
jgi:predicted permease